MPLNIDFRQVLLHLMNFVILFGALYFLLYGPVKKFMEKREQMYKDMDDKAKKNLEDSERTKAEYEQKLADANAEIAALKNDAQASSQLESQKLIDNAKAEADKILRKAHDDAKKEHDERVRAASKDIAAAASQMAEKIVGQSVSESYDSFIAATKRGNDND